MIKLIYILGFARSGTTILGNLLGEVEGFVHVGELCRLWRRAAFLRDRCGCDRKMIECPLWSRAIPQAFQNLDGSPTPMTLEECISEGWERQKKAEGSTTLRGLLIGKAASPAVVEYGRLMEEVLKEVARLSEARVIVDSSKLVVPSAYATEMPGIRPNFIHVIRDSRGAVLSRQRKRAPRKGDTAVLNAKTTVADCFRWTRSNVVPRFLERNGQEHFVLRYENFLSDPAGTLRSILAWVDEPTGRLPLSEDGTARFGVNHTVSGNRNRFKTGEVRLVLDDAWKRTLRSRDYLLITALTAPLLARYGYGMRRMNGASRGSSTHAA